MNQERFAIVGKDTTGTEELQTLLRFMGYEVVVLIPALPGLNLKAVRPPWQAVLVDLWEPATEVRTLIQALRTWPDLPIVLVEPRDRRQVVPADLITCSQARLIRPFRLRTFELLLKSLCRPSPREPLPSRSPGLFRSLTGTSAAIEQVRSLIERVAPSSATVLITGETGTGKEVVARNLHYFSHRPGPFVAVNCGAIAPDLLESELFGHEKGAFTGADRTQRGRFEQAERGTLFLDEIGDMPTVMQVKLLRVLQERTFERMGSAVSRPLDIRLIAATHRRLEERVRQGHFREDLFYRLCVFPIEMPPLRKRPEDLPLLVADLNTRLHQERGVEVRLGQTAMTCLQCYPWPGNVRELANLVERLSLLYPNRRVEVDQLPAAYRKNPVRMLKTLAPPNPTPTTQPQPESHPSSPILGLPSQGLDLKSYLIYEERRLLQAALRDSQGVVAQAAKRLGLRRTTLVEKLRRHRLMDQDPQR